MSTQIILCQFKDRFQTHLQYVQICIRYSNYFSVIQFNYSQILYIFIIDITNFNPIHISSSKSIIMNHEQSLFLSPEDFIQTVNSFTFQQKYFKWQSYLSQQKLTNSAYYQASLQKFVEYYPFNYTYWSQLLDVMLKLPKGKSNTLKMYQVALAKNPRCITLWKKYLDWLKKQLYKSDPQYLRVQLQNASKIIGNHYKSSFIFQYYHQLQPNTLKKYTMLKRAIVSPIQNITKIKQIFNNFIDSQQFMDNILVIAQHQCMSIQQSSNNIQQTKNILQQQIRSRINTLYQPTKIHVQQRQVYQNKIVNDQYIPYTDSIQNWRQYINFIKQSGNIQFLPSIYQRALINQCDNEGLWQQYFLLLQNQSNHQRALYLLRFHSLFFRNMSKQLTYYWLQIQQRDNPIHARQLYLQLQHNDYDLQIFLHHIQMQLRSKQYNNAKIIYQTILTVFTTNLSIITYTVLQYADFSVRYFRDVIFAKKLLQNYFRNYSFSQYLFIGLLEFYEKNIEYKQGTKQAKQIVDQFIQYLLLGLKKAYESIQYKQYIRIKKISYNHMRSYIVSIYLIKGAQRKLKQQEVLLNKQEHQGKRNRDDLGKVIHEGIVLHKRGDHL